MFPFDEPLLSVKSTLYLEYFNIHTKNFPYSEFLFDALNSGFKSPCPAWPHLPPLSQFSAERSRSSPSPVKHRKSKSWTGLELFFSALSVTA